MTPEQWKDLKEQKEALKMASRRQRLYHDGTRFEKTKPIMLGRNEQKRQEREAQKLIRLTQVQQEKAARKNRRNT